jgi:hypothetical protein
MFRYKVPDTPSCYANFLRALAPHGMGEKDMVANINFIMNVPVQPDGTLITSHFGHDSTRIAQHPQQSRARPAISSELPRSAHSRTHDTHAVTVGVRRGLFLL